MRTAVTAIVAAAVACVPCARAADIVADPILTTLTSLGMGETAASWATQAAAMTKEIAQVTAILQEAQVIYSLMDNPIALLEVAPMLLTDGQTSPLGQDITSTLQLAGGLGRLIGTAANLARQVETQNTVFTPGQNGNFNFNMLIMRANQTSAIQAQMQTLMTAMTARLAGLQILQAQINLGGDVNRIATLHARMASETAMAQNQGQQMQSLIGLATLQEQIEKQQYIQKAALDDSQFLAARTAASGGLVNFLPTGSATPTLTAASVSPAVGSFPTAP
jgi:hypothetical protein